MINQKEEVVTGLSKYRNKNGFTVLELHYSANPAKRSHLWKQQEASLGMSAMDWSREYELSWTVRSGKAVYNDYFVRDRHVFGPSTRRGDYNLPTAARLVVGYDMGPTASRLAASFNLFEDKIPRRWTIDEVFVERASIDEFLDLVELKLLDWQFWGDAIHVVDPAAIEQYSQIEGRACVDLLRLRGIDPHPGERSFVKRRQYVEYVLSTTPGLLPYYNVHERCTMHVEGFEGMYHYPEVTAARGGGYGAMPVKNGHSDIHDALQYALSRADIVSVRPVVNRNNWVNSYVSRAQPVDPEGFYAERTGERIVIGKVGI